MGNGWMNVNKLYIIKKAWSYCYNAADDNDGEHNYFVLL